jgi:hypothetical protein
MTWLSSHIMCRRGRAGADRPDSAVLGAEIMSSEGMA